MKKILTLLLCLSIQKNVTSQNIDCNGIINGSSIMDSCGVCQQSYIYNYVTHAVIILNDTIGITLGPNEMLVMANNPQNPYWNSSCIDCNNIINGSSMMDSCGVCQQSYIYNYVTHAVIILNDTIGITLGPNEMLVMPNNPQNPYWNSSAITSYDTIYSNTSITWNGIYLTESGDYTDSTLISSNGYCDSIANLNFILNNTTNIITEESKIKIIKITDILGRPITDSRNHILLYIKEDGTVEKRIILE